jgi:hypothetical protein
MNAASPYFDATSYLITDNSSILNNDVHSIFFLVRFNGTSANYDKIFTFNCGGSDRSPGVWRHPNQAYLHWRYDPGNSGCDFGKNTSNQNFDLNTWYYVGVTKNGATATCYVNGVYANQATVSSPKTSGSASMYFFEGHTSAGLTHMSCCHIYNRVLSATEVANNYNAIRGRIGG